MKETLTFAPRSKRKEAKRAKGERESEDARARYDTDNNE